jgi:hypothetical protein
MESLMAITDEKERACILKELRFVRVKLIVELGFQEKDATAALSQTLTGGSLPVSCLLDFCKSG